MIQNERQYEICRKKLADLERALAEAASTPTPGLPAEIQDAGRNGIRMLMDDLQTEMAEFERLKGGETKSLPLSSVLDDLPRILVQARVARGWTHRDLARKLKTTEQQVQKDESGGYAKASLPRLHRVADALNVTITGRARLNSGTEHGAPKRAAGKSNVQRGAISSNSRSTGLS